MKRFLTSLLAAIVLCCCLLPCFPASASAWEPTPDDEYTVISLKLPDGRLRPIFYMPVGSDGYTASFDLTVDGSNGISLSWGTDNNHGTDSLSVSSLLSLYGLRSGDLTGLDDGTRVLTSLSIDGGSTADPETPLIFVFEPVFTNAVPNEETYIMQIYNQSGDLLKTLSGSGTGSPFKAVIYPGINHLFLSVFDSSWQFTSKDLLRLNLDPSVMQTVSASQIINAGTSGFQLTAVGNILRVTLIYDAPSVSPDPDPDSGAPPALAYFGAFLTTVLGAFLSFELIPGLTLGGMFGFFLVLAIAVCVLKHFAG